MCFSVWGRWCRYFFPRWYPNCVKFDPAVLSFFKKSWVAELRIGWVVDYAKGLKIFVFFRWRYKKYTKMRKPEELSLTRRRTLEREEPPRRGMSYVWPALSRHFRRNSWHQLPFLMLDFFKRLLDLRLREFLHVESTQALTLPSEPPRLIRGGKMWMQQRELLVQIQVKLQFYIFYCKCYSSHFLYSVLILYVK